MFDRKYIKRHAIYLLPELHQPHGVLFGCKDDLLIRIHRLKPLPDILPVVYGKNMMVVVMDHGIGLYAFLQVMLQRSWICDTGYEKHLCMFVYKGKVLL